jgi:DNA-binding response OmpR family regulator
MSFEGKLLLLADDDRGLVDRVRELFGKVGATVETAGHLEGAQAILSQSRPGMNPFACAIVDVMLPRSLADQKKIAEYEEDLVRIRQSLAAERDEDSKRDWRTRRYEILLRIDALLDKQAGFAIAEMAHEKMPIVFLTAVNDPETRVEGHRRWPDAQWLTKPTLATDLIAVVESVCKEGRHGAP